MLRIVLLLAICFSISIGFISLIYFMKIKENKPKWYKDLEYEEKIEYYKELQKKGTKENEKRR